jgi:hypothetical protein
MEPCGHVKKISRTAALGGVTFQSERWRANTGLRSVNESNVLLVEIPVVAASTRPVRDRPRKPLLPGLPERAESRDRG